MSYHIVRISTNPSTLIYKKILYIKMIKESGLRICNFGSKIVQICPAGKNMIVGSLQTILLCKVGEWGPRTLSLLIEERGSVSAVLGVGDR